MANLASDYALGRPVELWNRVDNNDPANSAFILVVLAASGLETDAVLRTYSNLSALLAAANNEVTNAGYARKTLTDANISAYTVDTSSHTITPQLATQTFTTITSGDSWRKLLFCYDSDTTGGTDANIEVIAFQDLLIDGAAVVPNGNDILVAFPDGVLTAS